MAALGPGEVRRSEGAAGRGGRGKDKTSVGPQRTRPCLQAESWGRASWKEEAWGGGPGVVEAGSDHSPLSRAGVEVAGHAHVLLAAFEKVSAILLLIVQPTPHLSSYPSRSRCPVNAGGVDEGLPPA